MEIDLTTGTIHGKYLWHPCMNWMTSNAPQAQKIQESIEKHMIKAGTLEDFNDEMEKALAEEKVRDLSESEMSAWHGPIHYVTVFPVIKPDSISTKTRIVSNAVLKNSNSRLSLNDCMEGGPNALAELLTCLLFWRGVAVAIMMDLRKAYQAIHTSETELHLRRFFYRKDPGKPWMTLVYTRATWRPDCSWRWGSRRWRTWVSMSTPWLPLSSKTICMWTTVSWEAVRLRWIGCEDDEKGRNTLGRSPKSWLWEGCPLNLWLSPALVTAMRWSNLRQEFGSWLQHRHGQDPAPSVTFLLCWDESEFECVHGAGKAGTPRDCGPGRWSKETDKEECPINGNGVLRPTGVGLGCTGEGQDFATLPQHR